MRWPEMKALDSRLELAQRKGQPRQCRAGLRVDRCQIIANGVKTQHRAGQRPRPALVRHRDGERRLAHLSSVLE